MTFKLGNNVVFIDSIQFLSSNLEDLVKNVPKICLKNSVKNNQN